MRAAADAPFLNILEPAFRYDGPEVADARERSWYAMTPLGVMVLRHEEAWDLLRDRRLGKGPEHYMGMHGIEEGPLYDFWMGMPGSRSVEDHARLRGLVNKAFSPRMVESLRPFVRETAERLIDQIAGDEVCEFVAAFADPLPALVMCRMLGVPSEDYDRFHHCSTEIGLAYSRSVTTDRARIEAAIVALSDYLEELIADRRRHLGDDLLSTLIQVEEEGQGLAAEELHNLVMLLVWAGQDTTARQIGRALVAFCEHPDQWALLAERPELARGAAEEVCRWSPQARTIWRFASEDLAYKALEIRAGTMVLACVVSANRDPRVFDNPERLDITSTTAGRQLEFGGGISYCLGASVARLEMAEGLVALTQRLGPPAVAGPIVWRPPRAFIHGPDVLPLRFAPRS